MTSKQEAAQLMMTRLPDPEADEIIYVPDTDDCVPVRVRDIVVFKVRYWEMSDIMDYDIALKNGSLMTGEIGSQDGIDARNRAKDILRYCDPIWNDFVYYGSSELRAEGVAMRRINLEKIISMDLDLGIVSFKEPPVKDQFWPVSIQLRGEQEKWRIFDQWELFFRQKGFRVLKSGQGNVFCLDKNAVDYVNVG